MGNDNKLADALKKYKKENLYIRSWEEYSKELNTLTEKVIEYIKNKEIIIDAVIPIERGGNFPGSWLAYKLNVLRIIPVQYKYFFLGETAELRQLLGVPDNIFSKDDSPTFLLVEGNHCYGNMANVAAKDLKNKFPKCRIIYAASNMDYNYQNAVEDAEISFHGRLQNDCKELSEEECIKNGIDPTKTILFPWESLEEEWQTIQLKQYSFGKVEEIRKKSRLVQTIKLE
ncbi:MAG: phosphoribosyltransferase [Nanoarchaeota archaeon]|nr:phosphoribosyltransferase [Nanoarchaeota archaeon]MBU4124146.1 phosphoribosyltransferase [Nanoarchaeota archaeon]